MGGLISSQSSGLPNCLSQASELGLISFAHPLARVQRLHSCERSPVAQLLCQLQRACARGGSSLRIRLLGRRNGIEDRLGSDLV